MNDAKPYVVANLKANKNWEEIKTWLEAVGPKSNGFEGTVIFAPSFPFLASSKAIIESNKYNLKLASQDVSQFEQGAYTGEVAASQIKDLVSYAIVGHSERRRYLQEEDIALVKKTANAANSQIEVIYCVQDENTQIPDNIKIVAYEPPDAIGTNNPEDRQKVFEVAKSVKKSGDYTFLYGGSVSADNVKSYLETGLVEGVLVGATNSLDPEKFLQILKQASF